MLSVIIATSESEHLLVRTLSILIPGAVAGIVREVIVADAGSNDATATVADHAGCRLLVSSAAPRGARLKAAAASARAPWLLFLQPGTVLYANWIDDAARFIAEENERSTGDSRAAVLRARSGAAGHRSLLQEALSLLWAAVNGGARSQQGLLIAKRLYDSLGGHRQRANPEADLRRRLGRRRIIML